MEKRTRKKEISVNNFYTASIGSSAQLAQKLLLIHAVLEGFASVNENHRHLVIVFAAHLGIRVYVDFTPGKPSALLQLDEAFFYDLAEMASFARIHYDIPRLRHATECSSFGATFLPHTLIVPIKQFTIWKF
jgi:hypothetical protein